MFQEIVKKNCSCLHAIPLISNQTENKTNNI